MNELTDVYQEYRDMIHRFLLRMCGNQALAEELTQETFYQAVKSIDRYDESCKMTTWLCAIAKNSLAVYRRKHPVTDELSELPGTVASAESETLNALGQVELLRALHALAGDTREVLYLRLLGGLSFREIGDILSRTENWARVTYYRGREKLKGELDSDG